MFHSKFLIATSVLMSALPCIASGEAHNVSDFNTDTLEVSTVIAEKGFTVSREDTVSMKGCLRAEEALMKIPGLLVNDMGGPGGLKTVSLRGLGTAQTAIFIDGVRVGNLMSGQSDLSMMSLGNFSRASVDYAQNSVMFKTARPVFGNSPVAGKVRFYAGSFGTYLPYARLDFRLSDKVSLSANAAGVFSKGDFVYGDGQVRTNNDIEQYRGGLDLFGIMDGGDYHVKAYYSQVERGTPGSVTCPSDDRQKDKNAFIKGYMTKAIGSLYTLHASAKGSYDDIYYSSAWGDSNNGQTELQIPRLFLLKRLQKPQCRFAVAIAAQP